MGFLQGKEVLIIDDSADVRLFVHRILESEGAVVIDAETVDEGVAIASSKAPHLILTDLTMPGKTGFDFLKERKKSDALRAIPTLVLSGLTDRESITEAIGLAATDYVLKPLRAPLLLQKVKKHLKSRSFLAYKFPEGARPKGQVSLSIEILKAGEAGLQIESPVKFAPEQTVVISGEFLEKIECKDVMTRTSATPVPYMVKGRYVTEVGFIGVDEKLARKIREKLKEWK